MHAQSTRRAPHSSIIHSFPSESHTSCYNQAFFRYVRNAKLMIISYRSALVCKICLFSATYIHIWTFISYYLINKYAVILLFPVYTYCPLLHAPACRYLHLPSRLTTGSRSFLQRKTDSGQIFIYHRAYLRNVYIHIQNHPVARNHNLYLAGFRQSLHKKIDQHFHMSFFSILYILLDEASRANFRPAGIFLRLS